MVAGGVGSFGGVVAPAAAAAAAVRSPDPKTHLLQRLIHALQQLVRLIRDEVEKPAKILLDLYSVGRRAVVKSGPIGSGRA